MAPKHVILKAPHVFSTFFVKQHLVIRISHLPLKLTNGLPYRNWLAKAYCPSPSSELIFQKNVEGWEEGTEEFGNLRRNRGCHSNWCKMVPQCGFDLHFSNDQWWWTFFHMFVGLIYVFFWKVSVHVLCPLLNGFVSFFSCLSVLILCRFWILALCQMGRLQNFFPILLVAGSF